jgi:hypothetical protein
MLKNNVLHNMCGEREKRCVLKSKYIPVDGGAGRDRTDDIVLAKHALSQLSYSPILKPTW